MSVCVCVCVRVQLQSSRLDSSATRVGCSPPGSFVGFLETRILEQAVISLSRDPPVPGIEPNVLSFGGKFFTTEPLGSPNNKPTAVQTGTYSGLWVF